eukprot:scaffold1.g5420.t1
MTRKVLRVAPVEARAPSFTQASQPLQFLLEEESGPKMAPAALMRLRELKQKLSRLLATRDPLEAALESAAEMAWDDAGGSVDALAAGLHRIGYDVSVATSAGGALRQLRHRFATVALGAGRSLVVDPAFREQFELAGLVADTPIAERYRRLLVAVPPLVVASRHRLNHATLLLAEEMAAVFEAADMPLPPWRQPGALLSKWEAAEERAVGVPPSPARSGSPTSSSAASPATASPGSSPDTPGWLPLSARRGRVVRVAAPATAAAANVRRAKDLARVQDRLARLGLADFIGAKAGSPGGGNGGRSPVSVVQAALPASKAAPEDAPLRVVGFALAAPIDAPAHEWVCRGFGHERVCGGTGMVKGMAAAAAVVVPLRQGQWRRVGPAGLAAGAGGAATAA